MSGLAYVGDLATLVRQSGYFTFVGPFQGRPLRPHRAVHQAMAVGVEAIPIVSLITFFVGLIMALQSGYELRQLGAMQLVAGTVAISILRELGPAAYSHRRYRSLGVGFRRGDRYQKGDRGSGCVENDGLRSRGVPGCAEVSGNAGDDALPYSLGRLHGNCGEDLSSALPAPTLRSLPIFQATRDAIVSRDIYTGLIKSVLFGLVITAVGCKEGFSNRGGRRGGRAFDNCGRRHPQ